MTDFPFVHEDQYKELSGEFKKLYDGLISIFRERDSARIVPCFKDGWQPPKEIRMRTISEDDFERLQRLDKLIDEVRIKVYG